MATEIELKYLIENNNVVDRITTLLADQKVHVEKTQHNLENCYFDTVDLKFRQYDMGLRLRSTNGKIEQTIKTDGQVVGGLHQRPEYNVPLTEFYPNLSLFPAEIWSEQQDIDALQQELESLFNTDFSRTVWLLKYDNGTVIELAYDLGEIETKGQVEKISEIEMELVSGTIDDLISLASLLVQHFPVRPGIHSKAARGYALCFNQQSMPEISPLELIPLQGQHRVNQSFATGLQFSLHQLQVMLDGYVRQPSLDYLVKVVEIVALIRHGFWLYLDYLPEEAVNIRDQLTGVIQRFKWVDEAIYFQELIDKTGNYRRKIDYSKHLLGQLKIERSRFPEAEHVIHYFQSSAFNQLQLSLLSLLIKEDGFESERAQQQNDLREFAKQSLEQSLALVNDVMLGVNDLSGEDYLSQRKLLNRSLLTGSWFGSLYDEVARTDFRDPWLDIKTGISELQTLFLLKDQLQLLDEQPQKLLTWLDSKVENLLMALNSSRVIAIANIPYWR